MIPKGYIKRLLCVCLALLTLAALLASCAGVRSSTPSRVRITSSDAADAAAWLEARLGERLTDSVVLGTDASEYDVDLAALEADGFFIRSFGREDVLFAKTPEGLDRAVRKYAKMVEAGAVADVTYHEGYRVKRLTVAGEDISTFAVRVEGSSRDEDATGLRARVESVAAPAVPELIGAMCGATLADAESAEHFIVFRPTDEDGWGEGTYRYAVEDGDLIFEYAELLGAKYALLTFLEDECGWKNVSAGLDMLAESDGVDIPADLDVTVEPLLEGLYLHTNAFGIPARNSAYQSAPGYRRLYEKIYRIPHACHGWRDNDWGHVGMKDKGYGDTNACLTNGSIFQNVMIDVINYIENKKEAGAAIGYDLNEIDVSHADTPFFCKCASCSRAYKEEGGIAGVYVRFANAVAEELEKEGYGGLKVLMFAYGFHEPPKLTAPRGDVWITYCMDDHCIVHPASGECCQTEFAATNEVVSGEKHARRLREWAKLTDNLYVWNYDLDYNVHPYIIVEQIWDDMRFFSEIGVTRMFWQMRYHGLGLAELHMQLAEWLDHHPDATKAEYNDEYFSLLELHFGSGWEKVAEAFALWEKAETQSGECCPGAQYYMTADPAQMDYKYYLGCQDEILSLLDSAIADADSAANVAALEELSACHLYHGCFARYFVAYETGDEAQMKRVEDDWALMLALLRRNGKDTDNMEGAYFRFPLYESVFDFAWDSYYGWSAAPAKSPKDFGHNRLAILRQFGLCGEEDGMKAIPDGVEFKVSGRVPED